MPDYLQRYLPEFDENEMRERLAPRSREELVEMLLIAYKEKRVLAKLVSENRRRMDSIKQLIDQPTELLNMPDVPSAEDLRRMTNDEDPPTKG